MVKMKEIIYLLFWFICLQQLIEGRIHKVSIKNDLRRYFVLSSFGFYKGGTLEVKLNNFFTENSIENDKFGFSLEKSVNDAMNPVNLGAHIDHCMFDVQTETDSVSFSTFRYAVFFVVDRKNKVLNITCSPGFANLHIYPDQSQLLSSRIKRDSLSDHMLFSSRKNEDAAFASQREKRNGPYEHCTQTLPLVQTKQGFNFNFIMLIATEKEEGLYNLFFQNCPNYLIARHVQANFHIEIEERNNENFLSAGEMALPTLYFMMSLLFFLTGCFWVFILVKSNHAVFKIHYLMAVLVYLKSLSLLFHSINYHFIETKGEHVAAWAILFYITHLLKGSVLFITIVLIGTGWTFVKPLLSERDKKIFMIVIPLQVLANVVKIIIEETEEGELEHKTWLDLFMLIDLLCCGAILFPVVWSIKYLQEASTIDGKAAINLRKLKLFRQFYIMIVCYIYFTRIVVILLQMTVSFKYEWLDEMFREMVTYVFYVLTAYKFRPESANPYFQVSTEDDDEDIDIVVSQCGVTEGLSKLSRISSDQAEDDNEVLLLSKRESSHEYD